MTRARKFGDQATSGFGYAGFAPRTACAAGECVGPSGALAAFGFHAATLSDVEYVLVDGGYRGKPFARAVQEVLGAGVEVVKRSDMPRFTVIPKQWVLERSFPWL